MSYLSKVYDEARRMQNVSLQTGTVTGTRARDWKRLHPAGETLASEYPAMQGDSVARLARRMRALPVLFILINFGYRYLLPNNCQIGVKL